VRSREKEAVSELREALSKATTERERYRELYVCDG